jgi:Tfp pilus assembly protein PilF
MVHPSVAAPQATASRRLARGLFDSPGRLNLILCLLLSSASVLLYRSVAHHSFVNFDDDDYITQNPHVQAGLSRTTLAWAFHSTEASNWHPVTWLVHAFDWQLFGGNPAGHLYVNLVLHVANTLLLFWLLKNATGFPWRSLVVAAVFAVHPINVESVAWASELKNTLSTFFFLLALAAYGWHVRKPAIDRYAVLGLAFALSLMSKPMAVTLPFVLLLLDYWPFARARSFSWLALEKIPLLTLSISSSVITMIAQRGAMRAEYSLPQRLGNSVISYSLYLGKAIWPAHLAAIYPHLGSSLPIWAAVGSAIFLLSVTASSLVLRRYRYLATGWFWYLGTMVPVIGLVQVGKQGMADRYAYVPFIGLFVALVWGVADWAGGHNVRKKMAASAAFGVIAMLSLATYLQVGYWKDSITLWSHAIAVTGDNYAAQDCLGDALLAEGKWDQAIVHFQAASRINPRDAGSQINLAVYERRHGQIADSVERYQNVLRWTADPTLRLTALENLGAAYRSLGDYSQALESYNAALQLDPKSRVALTGSGVIAQKTGDLDRAIDLYSRVVASRPTDVGYLLLAQALEKQGRTRDAQAAAERAKQISGDLEQARQHAGQMLNPAAHQPVGSRQ